MESLIIGWIVKATIVLLAAFALTSMLRGASAAVRHAIWSAALAGVIAVPVLTIAVPWRVAVLPVEWSTAASELSTSFSASDLSETPTPTPTPTDWKVAGDEEAATADRNAAEGVGPPEDSRIASILTRDPWRLALFAWLGIASLILARILFGMAWMWRLARRAEPLSGPAWILPLGRVTERLDLRTAVRVVRSDAAPMPVTCGVLRPAVVLPEDAEDWTEERREAVLLHELAHIRRGDLATHLIAWVACSLYWFHPLVWLAARRLRHESERACDDLVLGAGTRASEYATHLLDIVRSAGRGTAPAAAVPMAQKSSFEGRLLAILEPGVARQALTARKKVAVAAGLALVVIPLAAMSPASSDLSAIGTPFLGEAPRDGSSDPIPLDGSSTSTWTWTSTSTSTDVEYDKAAVEEAIAALDGMGLADSDAGVKEHKNSGQTETQADGRMVEALAVALRDPSVDVRLTSAQALGSLGDPRAVDALLAALRSDSDAGVRKMAAWALGEIEDARAVDGLSEAVRSDRDVEVRAMSAWALGEIESPQGVPALGAALRDSSVEVRRMAVWALGEVESAEAVEWLTPALRDEDVEIRRKAAWALGEIESPAAVGALGGAMGDSDAEVRATAAWALGEIESPEGVEALRPGIQDADLEVRRKTVWALGEIQDPRAVPILTAALRDSDRETRKTAVWALGEIQDPSSLPALRPLLQDPDEEIRSTAIWALMEMEDPAVYDVLVELLKDPDPEVRKRAAQALGDM